MTCRALAKRPELAALLKAQRHPQSPLWKQRRRSKRKPGGKRRARRARQDLPGRFVYFIWCDAAAAMKVGCSRCIANRLSTLQGGNPFPLALAGAVYFLDPELAADFEAALHAVLRPCWIRGEWYAAPKAPSWREVLLRVGPYLEHSASAAFAPIFDPDEPA